MSATAKRKSGRRGGEVVASAGWDSRLLGRLIAEARPHARLFAATFAILAGLFGLELLGPWLIRAAIDGPVAAALAHRAEVGRDAFDPAPFVRSLAWWAGAYLACTLVTVVLRYFEVAHLNRTGQRVIADLRVKVFRHMQRQDVRWFDKNPTGALTTRVTTDVENLNELFTSGLVVLLADALKIVALAAILFTIHVRLALLVIAMLPVLVGISLAFRGGARSAHRAVRARLAIANGYLQEVLSGIRVVQVFGRERRVSARFGSLLDDYLKANVRTILMFALFYPTLNLAVTGIQGATVWTGGIAIAGEALTFGLFFQFWLYVNMLLTPVRQLGERYNVLQSAFASAERIFDILDNRPAVVASDALAIAAKPGDGDAPGHVRFDGVSFAYDPDTEVLTDVSFEIPPGKTVAVVGATGAGKTTLVNLLLRFYDPTAGRITIDGEDLRAVPLARLRRRVGLGLVFQEDFLFAGSLRDNLVMGRDEVDDDALRQALAASRAERIAERQPEGLDAAVAERGANLSTGERQLLAIARALAGRPRLVVLDEATASIDSELEAQIEAAQRNLLSGRSALVIAHRLSTIRHADTILVMHRGRLRERGTHAELLDRGGIYARLHELQFAASA